MNRSNENPAVPITETRLHVQGADATYSVAVSEAGGGTPVVLLHANASSRRQWRPLATQLADRHRVLAADLYGHGDSPLPAGAPATFTSADETAVVTTLAEQAGGPVHLVGHSYGGLVALRAALALGPRLRSLTLIEPAAFELLWQAQRGAEWEEVRRVAFVHLDCMRQGRIDHAADIFMGYWMGDAWKDVPSERRAPIEACMPAVARAWELILQNPLRLAACAGLNVPTLLIQGAETQQPCRAVVELLREAIPQCTLATVPDAGHMSPLTHPEAVNAVIAEHLSRQEAAWNRRFAAERRPIREASRSALAVAPALALA